MEYLSPDQLEQWISYYYKNPQPNITPMAIDALRKGGYLSTERSVEPISVLLSFIFRFNPEKIETWLAPFREIPNHEKLVIAQALWYSNTLQARNYLATMLETANNELKELINSLLRESPQEIDQIPIFYPSILDMLWAAFMATGDEKYVIRLMSVLPYVNAKDNPTKQMIGDTAKWSLMSNAIKHEKVKFICVNQLTRQSEDIASILKEIVTETENLGSTKNS
jgi:hypothetical protein